MGNGAGRVIRWLAAILALACSCGHSAAQDARRLTWSMNSTDDRARLIVYTAVAAIEKLPTLRASQAAEREPGLRLEVDALSAPALDDDGTAIKVVQARLLLVRQNEVFPVYLRGRLQMCGTEAVQRCADGIVSLVRSGIADLELLEGALRQGPR